LCFPYKLTVPAQGRRGTSARIFASAKRGRDARAETKKLKEKGIILPAQTRDAILEEIPEAYKDGR
jgi:RNA-splicing ligase RtcB